MGDNKPQTYASCKTRFTEKWFHDIIIFKNDGFVRPFLLRLVEGVTYMAS